jgi:hypothetical protein
MSEQPHEHGSFDRRDLIRLGLLIVVLLVVSGVIALASSGSGGSDKGTGPNRGEVTGVITTITEDRLVLKPIDGGAEETFAIRGVDVRRLDLFHLQQHSAQSLPTTVVWLRDGGTRYAISANDAIPVT